MASRAMPYNADAEMSVLGITFLDSRLISKICEEVTKDMFYLEKHQFIFDAVNSLYQSNTPIDVTTIKDELDKKKHLNAIGGIEYLSEIIDSVVTSANLDYYIKILKENWVRRNLIDTATNIVSESYDEEDINALLDNAERDILNAIKSRQASEFVPIGEVLRRAQENLEQLAKNNRQNNSWITWWRISYLSCSSRYG